MLERKFLQSKWNVFSSSSTSVYLHPSMSSRTSSCFVQSANWQVRVAAWKFTPGQSTLPTHWPEHSISDVICALQTTLLQRLFRCELKYAAWFWSVFTASNFINKRQVSPIIRVVIILVTVFSLPQMSNGKRTAVWSFWISLFIPLTEMGSNRKYMYLDPWN